LIKFYCNDRVDSALSRGTSYVYKSDDNGVTWINEEIIVPSQLESGDEFTQGVSISDKYMVVGAIGDDDNGTDAGAAYIFK